MAKCSCGHADGGYTYHNNITFLNYCPACHRYGTLYYEYGSGATEGQWVCSHCDVDYCLVCGCDHGHMGLQLRYYKIPIPAPEPVVTNNTTTPIVELTPLEIAKQTVQSHTIL